MRVKTATVVQALKSHTHWIEGLPDNPRRKNVDRDCKVSNIVEGCLCIMAGSAYCDIRQWIAHRPRRKQLKRPQAAVWTTTGRKAIRELLELTISELEASRSFRTTVDVGPLPVAEPKPRSKDHLKALHQGRERHQQRQRNNRLAALERRGLNLIS